MFTQNYQRFDQEDVPPVPMTAMISDELVDGAIDIQEVPLQDVFAEEHHLDDMAVQETHIIDTRSDTVAFRISIWRFLCCTLPIVLCAIVSTISVHVCKNQGFLYGAASAAMWAMGIYFFNFCLVVVMIIYFICMRFCTDTARVKASDVTGPFNVINKVNVSLAILLAVIVVGMVNMEHKKYNIGMP